MKIAVFTCITNGVDALIEDQPSGADYYIFSDNDPKSKRWIYKPVKDIFLDPRRVARYYKILVQHQLPEYDVTIWMDGSIQMLVEPKKVVDLFLSENHVGTYRHPERDCIYDEGEECKRLFLDDPYLIGLQMKRYKEEGYPKHNGLVETKVVVRDNSPHAKLFNITWFEEIALNSKRDQLSFNYTKWKLDMPTTVISPPINDHGYFKYHKHKKSRAETNREHSIW